MYSVKMRLDVDNKELADKIKEEMSGKCRISVLNSTNLFGGEEVVIAIIAATPGIITTIASIIQKYMMQNEGKSVMIENDFGKRTYTGYSVKEIKDLEEFIMKDAKEINE